MVYVGSYDFCVYALSKTGSLVWKYETLSHISFTSPAISANSVIYIGSDDNFMHAINATNGIKLWTYFTDGPILSSPAIGPNGTLMFGSGSDSFFFHRRCESACY